MSSQKDFINEIAKRATDADYAKALQVLRDGMEATISVRAPRSPGETNAYAFVPDHQIRLASANMLIKVTQALPGTKQEIEVKDTRERSPKDMAVLAFEEIGTMARVLGEIAEAQRQLSEAKRQPVDITPRK
jgi:hypothetical protein